MKNLTIALLTMFFAMTMPMLALSASHGDHSAHGQAMADDMHKGHDMGHMSGGFVDVGKETQDGVVATVQIKAYDGETIDKMKTMGLEATHHVMVYFTDEKSGKPVAGGMVAVKVKGAEDTPAKPVMMMLMGDGFGSDVTVKGKGMYTFEIGTKLEDGKKRQFEVDFHNM